MDTFRAFQYKVAIVEAPVPMFSGRMSRETDVYYRLEVFTQTGSGGYDLMGLTKQQVIDDVLERYEAHLAFLTRSTERSEEHTSELQSLMRISYAVFCLKKKNKQVKQISNDKY